MDRPQEPSLFGPLGDRVYAADGIELWAGDCLDVMPGLPPVDAILADLPYATTRNHWDRFIPPKQLWAAYRALMGPRTPVVLFGSGIFTHRMVMSAEELWRYNLVWRKVGSVTGHLNAQRQPLREHEDLIVYYQRQPTYHPQMVHTGRRPHSRGTTKARTTNHWGAHTNTEVIDRDGWQFPRSVLEFPRPKLPRGAGHPTQKPVDLMRWLIRTYTNPGDLVLDNVAGAATTLVAARAEGRRAIGIELHPPHVEMAVARLESGSDGDHWPSPATPDNDKETLR